MEKQLAVGWARPSPPQMFCRGRVRCMFADGRRGDRPYHKTYPTVGAAGLFEP
jgi:hypothetical protein